jgi:hypothetical protein
MHLVLKELQVKNMPKKKGEKETKQDIELCVC